MKPKGILLVALALFAVLTVAQVAVQNGNPVGGAAYQFRQIKSDGNNEVWNNDGRLLTNVPASAISGLAVTQWETVSITVSNDWKVDQTHGLWALGFLSAANITNQSIVGPQFVQADINGKESGTLNGSSLTNITSQYTTNPIPALTISWGKAYYTNIGANFTAVIASPANNYYETSIVIVTNSSGSDFKITMPSGVWGTAGSGTPPAYFCTNQRVTKIILEHYGQLNTNAYKVDFAP